ncbi:cytochrome P450 4C1 isoform X2 [Anabrus simplex]|uniref:cytochrome P450 4C1 isoform X2 n=1 Tax=Anabrus simplex TaxID=316456 RepID=UPI0035A2AFA6
MVLLSLLELLALLLILGVTIVVWVLPFQWTSARVRKLLDQLPGPKAYPIIGNAHSFLVPEEDTLGVFATWMKEYGPVFRYWIFGTPSVMVSDPDIIEKIMNDHQVANRSIFHRNLKSWLENGLLTSEGEYWHRHRRLLLPAFHVGVLSGYVGIFNENSRILVEKLKETTSDDLLDLLSMWALSSLCRTSMGITLDQNSPEGRRYCKNIRRINELFVKRYRSVWLINDLIYKLSPQGREWRRVVKEVQSFTENVIKLRMAEYKNKEKDAISEDAISEDLGLKKRKSFLDILLEQSDALTPKELREEVDTFMFGGHETTAVTMNWLLYLLGLYPEEQEKVYQEIIYTLGDDDLTMENLRDLKYVDQVMSESQRLYPTVAALSRDLHKDINIKGYVLPANSTIVMPNILSNRSEEIYPEPLKFNPENFSSEAIRSRHRCSFMPFGYGPRKCIGSTVSD